MVIPEKKGVVVLCNPITPTDAELKALAAEDLASPKYLTPPQGDPKHKPKTLVWHETHQRDQASQLYPAHR
jgi:hypothetical protein